MLPFETENERHLTWPQGKRTVYRLIRCLAGSLALPGWDDQLKNLGINSQRLLGSAEDVALLRLSCLLICRSVLEGVKREEEKRNQQLKTEDKAGSRHSKLRPAIPTPLCLQFPRKRLSCNDRVADHEPLQTPVSKGLILPDQGPTIILQDRPMPTYYFPHAFHLLYQSKLYWLIHLSHAAGA